jgi:G-protein alpha subunit
MKDMLNAKIPTKGIKEAVFEIKNMYFHFFDVSGQKEQRMRWMPYFNGNTDAIFFCTSSAGYCQSMDEDPTVNRMLDSLAIFETLANHPLLSSSVIIIFFNKVDLLFERLKKYPVKRYLPHYFRTNDSKSFLEFLCSEFKRSTFEKKRLHIHATICTDKGLIIKTIDIITDLFFISSLKEMSVV